MTPRSLVGMTMGARKRRWGRDFNAIPQLERASVAVSMLAAYGVFPKRGNPLARRLRPCPGCEKCTDSPRLQVMGWVRRIGGRAKLTRIFSRWYQRAEYLLMIYRPGPKWNPAAGGGVTKADAWANMCNCLREHGELNTMCDGSGVLPAKGKVRR